jgi:putative hemolysin
VSAAAFAVGLLAIPVLIFLNAIFVAAEFALVSVRKTRVKEMAVRGIPRARSLERVLPALDRYLATTQLGITLASIGLGWLGEPALAGLIHAPASALVGERLSEVAAHSVAFGVAFLGIAFLHITLGELVPRTIALQSPARVALGLVIPLKVMERLLRPFVWLLNHSGRAIVRALGSRANPGRESQVHSVTELAMMVEASEEAGVLEPQEKAMMHGVLAFGDKTVGR